MTIWWSVACWISKAIRTQAHPHTLRLQQARTHASTDTGAHREVYNTAFPRRQWFCERVSVLTLYVNWLSCLTFLYKAVML